MKTKIYKNGLVIGKFYPFHKGHHFLIDFALKRTISLVVIVCQTEKYKIPADIRADWIKKEFPSVEVKILNHQPSLDTTSTLVSKQWADLTVDFLGYTPETIFSSEAYGEVYAKCMGSKHIMVDRERKTINISGTRIRGNLSKHWNYLDNSVKAYFAKRVVVLGAESTGTTTLAQDLAKHYKTAWVPEYGRLYYEGKMFSTNANEWISSEFLHIATMQNAAEEELAGKCNQILICDTDALATTIWHKRYVGKKEPGLKKLVNTSKHHLYILTNIDIPFKQDGTRDGEHLRSWMHHLFVKELTKRNLNFIIVEGSRKERFVQAVKKIGEMSKNKLLLP